MRIAYIVALVFFVPLLAAAQGQEQTRSKPELGVVASILPVHSLVSGVMDGVEKPHLLVPGGASPHSFALRPSDARRLERARAVFWIGPTLETFLERALKALARNAEVVSLLGADGVRRLAFREGGPWEAHAPKEAQSESPAKPHQDASGSEEGHRHGDDHGHIRISTDAHAWLDPTNAIAFVRVIAVELGHIDPLNKERYAANAMRVEAKLKALDRDLRHKLAAAKGKPYIVFHDGYQYFEARYGLRPAGSITVNPELGPGAKRLVEIRNRIRKDGAVCVFAEPQFEPKLVRTVIEGTRARAATLDPLGARLKPGPNAYFELLRNLARDLTACLGKNQ